MILTVTLNPAWDVTYTVTRLEPGGTHRTESVVEQPGGKGVNVSRVLHQLGYATIATGLAAGDSADRLRTEVTGAGIQEEFMVSNADGQVRRTLTVVEAGTGRATLFAEPGPTHAAADWPAFLHRFDRLAADADVVVLSGSLPGGVPRDTYRVLVEHAHAIGVPAIVDADGAALIAALGAGPDLVKPNIAELHAATGQRNPVEGGRRLVDAGAVRVVVSAGPEGLTGLDAEGIWRAVPPALPAANPTGAGDAAVAALAVGLAEKRTWPELLHTAAVWSAAAVLEPRAGVLATERVDQLAQATTVTPLVASC